MPAKYKGFGPTEEKQLVKFVDTVIKSGKQQDSSVEACMKMEGLSTKMRLFCNPKNLDKPFKELLEESYDLNMRNLSGKGGDFSEVIKNKLNLLVILTGCLGDRSNWSTEFFLDYYGKNYWFGFVKELEITSIDDDEQGYVEVVHSSSKEKNTFLIKKKFIEGNYEIGDVLTNKYVFTDSSKKKEEICCFDGFEDLYSKSSLTYGKYLLSFVRKYEFRGKDGSRRIVKDTGDGGKILFEGTEYTKYQINKVETSFVNGINEDLKAINRELILMKLALTSKINIDQNLIGKIKMINDFFSNFFHKYRKEIDEGMLHFDQEMIEEAANICETLLIITEETKNNSLDTDKESSYYSIFKSSNEFLLETIKKMMILTKIYMNEEENREKEIEKMIPTGIEYTMNPGFKKILETLLDSHKYRRNTILIGHAGFGKTFGCKISAQLLGLPYYKFSCNAQTQIEEFFGSISQNEKGVIVREKGPLTKMMEMGGLFVFDEFNSMSQEAIKALNGILDTIQGHNGEEIINVQISGKDFSIKVHKDFRVCLTGNPVEFIDDYGMLSRVTNDLSRRSAILNTCNDFSGKKFIRETIEEYFNSMNISNLDSSTNQQTFKKILIERTINLVEKLSIAVGKGHIEVNENNRFFVLNRKDSNIGALSDEAAMENAVIPISTVVLLPIKNIIDSFEEVKDANQVIHIFVMKNLSLLLNLTNKVQRQLFEDIKLNK